MELPVKQVPQLEVAVGVLLNREGHVLIAQRAQDSHMGGSWEFPGGKIVKGETPLQGLVRELQEELTIRVQYVRHLLRFSYLYPDRRVRLHVWQVLRWEGEPLGALRQPLRWTAVGELLNEGLLPADEEIVIALKNPEAVNTLAWQAYADAVSGSL
jgi:8-oxo-dGTP diphosphatase